MKGSEFSEPAPGITLGCISPEARELLDTIMEHWEKHLPELKKIAGWDHEPTIYGFAYWLVRWSGLIQPVNMDLDNPKEPVLVVTNKSGKLIHVGHPETFNKKLLGEYAKEGHQIKTTTIEKFRAKKWKWHWES